MAKRVATGKPRVGEQRNQSSHLTGLITFTGSTVVDLGRAIRMKGGRVDIMSYVVQSLNFEDAGGVATVHRLASVQNANNTFTINASKESGAAGVYAVATNPCTVRWTVLVTN